MWHGWYMGESSVDTVGSLELECLIKVKYHSSKRSKAVLPYHDESSGYINDKKYPC